MTPAIEAARNAGIRHAVHEYAHDPGGESYGFEAAHKLGLDEGCVFKTLVVVHEGTELAVGIVPVSSMLSMKRMARALGTKKVAMADTAAVERSTGYVPGGISPLGQRKKLRTVLDVSAMEYETIYVSAGRRGLEIELAPRDLLALTGGITASLKM